MLGSGTRQWCSNVCSSRAMLASFIVVVHDSHDVTMV